jgi:hypothetical protein
MPMFRTRPALVLAVVAVTACGGGGVQPGAGYRFSAQLPVAPGLAASAVLSFDVNDGGTGIEYVLLDLIDLDCAAFSAGSSHYLHLVHVPIESGRFVIDDPGIGMITGRFETADRARGKVTLQFDFEHAGALSDFVIRDRQALCDLGTLDWVAEAQG